MYTKEIKNQSEPVLNIKKKQKNKRETQIELVVLEIFEKIIIIIK